MAGYPYSAQHWRPPLFWGRDSTGDGLHLLLMGDAGGEVDAGTLESQEN